MSGMASTASGLASAERSPVGLPKALALMTRRMILPDLVLGTSLTNKTVSGVGYRSQNCPYVLGQLLLQILALLLSGSEDDKGHNDLTLDLIRLADDGCLSHLGMRYQCGLNLCVGDSVSGNLQHIIDSALDEEVSILVLHGLVASQVGAGPDLPVGGPVLLLVPLGIFVEGPEHGWPGCVADNVSSRSELAPDWLPRPGHRH